MLCYYKKYVDKKLPKYIVQMFEKINPQDPPTLPRKKAVENTIRFQLHIYLNVLTFPQYLIHQLYEVSFSHLKYKAKKYMTEIYSSFCTKIRC